jgi:catechol 2,3-dioxygenase-like lactoylglutathione lyase family enzyme
MSLLALHHVSIITADLGKSLPFYRDAFGLTEIARPSFSVSGARLACGDLQVHLVEYPEGTFRQNPAVDRNDWHFAFCTDNFDDAVDRLMRLGFREDLPQGDPHCLLIFRNGLAGFPQLYLRDPDFNVVEINGAP